MKMIMRLDKSQIGRIKKWNNVGAQTFNRDLAIMAGYVTYDAILVGAAGGRAGAARTQTLPPLNDRAWMYGSGGGGGGSLRLQGKLVDLPGPKVDIYIGKVGSPGANSENNTKAGNGTAGENTSFATHWAGGGTGGIGGDFDAEKGSQIEPNYINVQVRGEGGDGGSNSAGLGSTGQGGKCAMYEINRSGIPTDTPATNATPGTYVLGGIYPVVGGGHGGGGGAGRSDDAGTDWTPPRNGAQGNVGGLDAPGAGPLPTAANFGGCGGGASVEAITGEPEIYGCTGSLTNPNGAVVLKLS